MCEPRPKTLGIYGAERRMIVAKMGARPIKFANTTWKVAEDLNGFVTPQKNVHFTRYARGSRQY